MEEFDKYKELKYISLWIGIIIGTIAIVRYFGVTDTIVIFFVVVIVALLIALYLKDKELNHIKGQHKKSENGKKKTK